MYIGQNMVRDFRTSKPKGFDIIQWWLFRITNWQKIQMKKAKSMQRWSILCQAVPIDCSLAPCSKEPPACYSSEMMHVPKSWNCSSSRFISKHTVSAVDTAIRYPSALASTREVHLPAWTMHQLAKLTLCTYFRYAIRHSSAKYWLVEAGSFFDRFSKNITNAYCSFTPTR